MEELRTNMCRSSKTSNGVCRRRDGLSNDIVQVGNLKCAREVGVNLDMLDEIFKVSYRGVRLTEAGRRGD